MQSFRDRVSSMQAAIAHARGSGIPVIYVNDGAGRWDSDAPDLVRVAVEEGGGGDLIADLAPQNGDRFVLKVRYSGFDHPPLAILLEELEARFTTPSRSGVCASPEQPISEGSSSPDRQTVQ